MAEKAPTWDTSASEATAAEQHSVTALRNSVSKLSAEVAHLESQVQAAGGRAVVLPEDLGDFRTATPRIQGLVTRILQTHELSQSIASLQNNRRAPPKPDP